MIFITRRQVTRNLRRTMFNRFINRLTLTRLFNNRSSLTFSQYQQRNSQGLVMTSRANRFLRRVTQFIRIQAPTQQDRKRLAITATNRDTTSVNRGITSNIRIDIRSHRTNRFKHLRRGQAAVTSNIMVDQILTQLTITMLSRGLNNRLNNDKLRLVVRTALRAAKHFKQGLIAAYKAHSQRLIRVDKFRRSILDFDDSLTVRTTRRTNSTGRAETALTIQQINSRRIFSTRIVVLTIRYNRLLAFVNTTRSSQSFGLIRVMNIRQLTGVGRRMVNSIRHRESKTRTHTS